MTSEESKPSGTAHDSSGDASGERSDPRDGSKPSGTAHDSSGDASGERSDPDDVPLNITGHDAEKRRREADEMVDVLPDTDAEEADDGEEEEEVEPVELLVNLAKEGEIDPWDIDVVRVTDKFLDALDGADLRTSGRALFYASVLVRMKGDELLAADDPDDADELEPWELAMEGGDPAAMEPDFDPVTSLEAEMERRLERKTARGKPETLDELVRELRDAERGSWWKEHREYDTSGSPSGFSRGTQTLDYHSADDFRMDDEPTEGEVTGTTHDEHIELVIDDVRTELFAHYDAGRTEVLFREIAMVGGSRVQTFLALLFLAHRGQVRLQQDELFGDLWVQDPNAAVESGEVAAD